MVDRTDFLAKLTEEDRKLIKLFKDEVDRINLLYMKAIHSNDMTKANQLLKQIKKISNYLSQEYGKRAEVRLPQEYVKGTSYIDEVLEMDMVLENLSKQSIEAYLDELGPIHIEAVNALVDNSKNYVRSSLDGMERQALTMINELQQTQVREELAKGIISGEAKSNERLVDYFTSQGISGFKDRGGKYWSMDRYVDMLCRTETSIANTQGTINRGLELGITKFGIVEHPDCCEVCAEMNGDIVDIRDGVVELPPFHPNCRGYIYAVIDEDTEVKYGDYRDFRFTTEMLENYEIEEAKRFIEDKFQGQEIPIGKDNAIITSAYTGGLFADMNHALRYGYGEDIYYDIAEQFSEVIKNNITEVPGGFYGPELFRGISLPKDIVESRKEGDIYNDKAFQSFTRNGEVASMYAESGDLGDKVGVIIGLSNAKGMNVSQYTQFSFEDEIVIDKDSKFSIYDIDIGDDGLYHVRMKQL